MTEQQIRSVYRGGRGIPEHMIYSVLAYFNDHLPPGDFLCALLANNFMETCLCADEQNLVALPAWAALLYNEAPSGSCGSHEKVEAWLAMRQDADYDF